MANSEPSLRQARWNELAQSYPDQLAQELHEWKESILVSLDSFLEGVEPDVVSDELAEVAQELEAHPAWSPELPWSSEAAFWAALDTRLVSLRLAFLTSLGPTSSPQINAMVRHLDGSNSPARVAQAILCESTSLGQIWEGTDAGRMASFLQVLRGVAWDVSQGGDTGVAKGALLAAWEQFHENFQASVLLVPTRSPRWNSWILLLAEVQAGRETTDWLWEALDEIEDDLKDLDTSPELCELVESFREASAALRSDPSVTTLPQLLIDIDSLLTEIEQAPPASQVRQLCLNFEESQISTIAFHRGLEKFRAVLAESQRKAGFENPHHPHEAAFVQALAKLEQGMDILAGVERPSQAGQLAMGCSLIDEGLAELAAVPEN